MDTLKEILSFIKGITRYWFWIIGYAFWFAFHIWYIYLIVPLFVEVPPFVLLWVEQGFEVAMDELGLLPLYYFRTAGISFVLLFLYFLILIPYKLHDKKDRRYDGLRLRIFEEVRIKLNISKHKNEERIKTGLVKSIHFLVENQTDLTVYCRARVLSIYYEGENIREKICPDCYYLSWRGERGTEIKEIRAGFKAILNVVNVDSSGLSIVFHEIHRFTPLPEGQYTLNLIFESNDNQDDFDSRLNKRSETLRFEWLGRESELDTSGKIVRVSILNRLEILE